MWDQRPRQAQTLTPCVLRVPPVSFHSWEGMVARLPLYSQAHKPSSSPFTQARFPAVPVPTLPCTLSLSIRLPRPPLLRGAEAPFSRAASSPVSRRMSVPTGRLAGNASPRLLSTCLPAPTLRHHLKSPPFTRVFGSRFTARDRKAQTDICRLVCSLLGLPD